MRYQSPVGAPRRDDRLLTSELPKPTYDIGHEDRRSTSLATVTQELRMCDMRSVDG